MRVIQLSTMMGYFGGEIHLAGLASGLQARGHNVTCIVQPESELSRRLPRLGISVRALPLVDWFDPFSIERLVRLLKEIDGDILHTHLPRDYFLASVATLGTSITNVGTRHQLKPLSHGLLKRPFLNRFPEFIAVSEAVRRGLLQAGVIPPERLSVIYHGLAPAVSSLDIQDFRFQRGAGEGSPLIGFVGKLCPTKGVDTLIRAVGLLKGRWPDLKVLLVGEAAPASDYKAELVKLIRELGLESIVEFTGYLEGGDQLSRAFDVQVVPSLSESFGLVTLEAISAGVPVVVTNTGGSPEIVRDGKEGFHFTPGDEKSLAGILDRLLVAPELRHELGQCGAQRGEEYFSFSRMLDRTEEVYRRALGRSEPAGEIRSA